MNEDKNNHSEVTDPGISFIEDTQWKASSLVRDFDVQTNIIVVLSSAIFGFSITEIATGPRFELALAVLGFFSGLASIFALYTLHPPRFMRKRGQEESMMYNKKIVEFPSHKEYNSAVQELIKDKEKIIEQYSLETFNIYKYYYRPKRRLFNISRDLLIVGAILAFVFFLFELFI